MKNNITELVFILDRSGSMAGLESDTIGGFNAMLEKQKREDGECYVSTVLFDNISEVLHDRVRIADIKPMTDEQYTVRGCTALVDALGIARHRVAVLHQKAVGSARLRGRRRRCQRHRVSLPGEVRILDTAV